MRIPGDRLHVDLADASSAHAAASWVARAREFFQAGTQLQFRDAVPKLVLLGYAVELALKGFLLAKGAVAPEKLKKYGHSLSDLLKAAEAAGLPRGLLTQKEAENLDTLFDHKPGERPRFRAGIYPIAGAYGYSFGSEFVAAIGDLLDACEAGMPRPDAASLKQLHQQILAETAPLVQRRKPKK